MKIPLGTSLGFAGGGHWGMGSPVSIEAERHTALIGSTGTGKSTLLLHILNAHIHAGNGIIVIDPHGDLAAKAASLIPPHRFADLIWFDPSAPKVVGLNPLQGENKPLRLEHFLKIVSTLFGEDTWGPQSDFIARNFGLALLEAVEHPTPLHIPKMFYSEAYCSWVFEHAHSANLTAFYAKYREDWDRRQREQAAAPPTNKADLFLKPALKLVLGQEKGLDLRQVMDERRILIAYLPKGQLGEDTAAFLSSIIVAMSYFAAMERGTGQHPLATLIVDEFHSMVHGSSAPLIMSETRKYNLFLTIADQQGYEKAVYANVGNLLVARTGAEDAEALAGEIGVGRAAYISELPMRNWLLRRPASDPVRFEAFSPPVISRGPDRAIKRSQNNFGELADILEKKLNLFLANTPRR